MNDAELQSLLHEYADALAALEEYDRSRQLPSDRLRVDLTLSRKALRKLRQTSAASGKSMSRIVETAIERAEL